MSWFDTLFKVAVPLVSTIFTNSGNDKATSQANQATQQQMLAQQQANQLAQQKLGLAKQEYQGMQAAAAPGVERMRTLALSDPNTLTPTQMTALEEAQRQTLNGLANSGLRGSGRAVTASIRDVQGGLRNQFVDSNRVRADNAASALSGQFFNSGTNAAGVNSMQANVDQNTGANNANYLGQIGTNTAANTTANTSTIGKAIGDIGAIINEELKNKYKESSYGKPSEA